MNKKIWMINHHANDTYFDKGGRHYSLAKYLRQSGYEPIIICGNSVHGKGNYYFKDLGLWKDIVEKTIDVPYVFVKTRAYVGNGKDRILSMMDFYFNVKRIADELAQKYGQPNIIYASSVHPMAIWAGIKLAKKYQVKCITEIRDLWPESFVSYGLMSEKSMLLRLLRINEKRMYQKSDAIIFTAENMYLYIKERGWEKQIPKSKTYYINNGVDLEMFLYNRDTYQVLDDDLQNGKLFKVVYTGSIRQVNRVGLLLDAAKKIQKPNIKILIWGDGDEKEQLEKRVQKEQINNVVFKGRIDKFYIPYIVSHADLNIMHSTPANIFRFGISANKMFDYLAAERPVVVDFPCPYNPCMQCKAGVPVDEPTPQNVASAIEHMAMLSEDQYKNYCLGASAGAKEYDFKELTKKLITLIEGM